ncbi:MAG: hypothetical protein KC478_14420, partial [Bacteriovoracaceae bacterium]|nr:hypothetical protein [Bacteriovoracaceae bacterium]
MRGDLRYVPRTMYKNLINLIIFGIFTIPTLALSEDIVLGKYQKNVWNESLSDTFNGELVRLLHKKDDLFEKLAPELELDLNPYIDLSTKFSRSVKEHLPKLKGEKLTPFDFTSFKVSNQFQLDLEIKADAGVVFSQGETGLRLVHSSNHISSLAKDKCEFMHQVLDNTTEQGSALSSAHCSGNTSALSNTYNKVVDYFSSLLKRFFNQFADSERNKLFAQDPLAPLKLHTKLGVPLRAEIFEQDNHSLHIGDVIEHTTYYGIKPLGVEFNLFEFIKPSFYKFKRLFRSVRFQKLQNNKIAIEIEDTQISGNSTEIFKLRPKILAIIKLNFGKWASENFSSDSIIQRYEVDISRPSGKDFFKTVLKSMYLPSSKLFSGLLLTTNQYEAVKTNPPIYKDGNGEETRLVLKFPGVISYDTRNYAEVEKTTKGSSSYLSAERLQREYLKSKINFQLGPIGISKKQRSHECSVEFNVNQKESDLNDSTLALGCKYSNKYSTNEDKNKVLESIDIVLNGNIDDKDRETLEALDLKREPITMYNNVVFSAQQIKNIFSASEDKITSEISKMMFGENAKNIFSSKYKKIWRSYRGLRKSTALKNSNLFRKCSVMLAYYGITDGVDKTYDSFDGIVGNDKGIFNFKSSGCYSYYRAARKLTKLVSSLKEGRDQVKNANDVLELFDNIKQTGLAQN